jgi:hypothetical protein
MDPKLFMILLGCKPPGRHTEQHDIFFTVNSSIGDTKADVLRFWPEANGRVHMDAWREVNAVDGYTIRVVPKDDARSIQKLFFINLGGYREGEFDESHYKMLVVAESLAVASRKAKESAFYKHTGFPGAPAHIDDKYGVDVDDIYEINEILDEELKRKYTIEVTEGSVLQHDEVHLGYMPLYKS